MTDIEKWVYIITTIWQFDYQGKLRWLALWPDLDTAYAEAQKYHDGQIAT